jgi:preprotein translocase subunit SecB
VTSLSQLSGESRLAARPDVVRDGGMPPLMIEPIDFMALYQARVAQAQAAGQQPQGNA